MNLCYTNTEPQKEKRFTLRVSEDDLPPPTSHWAACHCGGRSHSGPVGGGTDELLPPTGGVSERHQAAGVCRDGLSA